MKKGDLPPRISIFGSIGLETSDSNFHKARSTRSLFSSNSLTYQYGPSFTWPILNYGRLRNRVRAERARFCQLMVNYQNTVLIAYQEVENGIATFVYAHDQVGYLKESVAAAARSAELARTQYVEGLADYTRVLNTETARLDEEEQLILAW